LTLKWSPQRPKAPKEGEDKPLKYRTIFNNADVAVITKLGLGLAVGFDDALVCKSIQLGAARNADFEAFPKKRKPA